MNGFHFTDRGNAVNEDFVYAGMLGTEVRTFLWTGYAASPRLLRYCIGLIQPSLSLGRTSL